MQTPVPEKHSGKQLDLKSSRTCIRRRDAHALYQSVKRHLLHPDSWGKVARVPGTEFKLVPGKGKEGKEPFQEGDYLKINIPGPKNQSGEGYDWVRVEDITEKGDGDQRLFSIRLRPCPNPENKDPEVAHFFTSLASSTLSVEQKGTLVRTRYYGRNEHINEENTHLSDKIRNLLVGGVAKSGVSRLQWQNLIERFLDEENTDARDH